MPIGRCSAIRLNGTAALPVYVEQFRGGIDDANPSAAAIHGDVPKGTPQAQRLRPPSTAPHVAVRLLDLWPLRRFLVACYVLTLTAEPAIDHAANDAADDRNDPEKPELLQRPATLVNRDTG